MTYSLETTILAPMQEMQCYAALLPPTWKEDVLRWLQNDIPSFDVGGFVVGEKIEQALLLGKSNGVLCGIPFVDAVFEALQCEVEWQLEEGATIDTSTSPYGKVVVAIVRGKARNLLMGERTALNVLTRTSGVATQARRSASIKQAYGWHGMVAGTRKTTPGFRLAEKYALIVGGCATHRQDLSQMVMLKDNHIWSAGNITEAVKKARIAAGFSMKIEVECQSLEEGIEAASAGADIVMLDNFGPEKLLSDAAQLKEQFPFVLIEGIVEGNMHEYMSPHVDIISRGSLTQGYTCLDFSLKIQPSARAAEQGIAGAS